MRACAERFNLNNNKRDENLKRKNFWNQLGIPDLSNTLGLYCMPGHFDTANLILIFL